MVDEDGARALGGAKQRAVLAVLVLHRGEAVSSERLIDEVWGDRPPATAAKTLQGYVSHLRKALRGDVLRTQGNGYVLGVEAAEFDSDRFEALAAEGRGALAAGNPARAATQLAAALGLWRGPALSDFRYESFAQAEIARLEEMRLAALEDRIDADLALGRQAQLVGELDGLTREHPLRERLRAQLMLALYRSGRQADALEAFQAARRALVDELGIEPGRPLRELHEAVLRQDPGLDVATEAESRRTVGEVSQRSPFVGRERELGELLRSLEDACSGRGRLVLVGGESGIGKSRLLDELAEKARERGARVLVGRCWEAGGAPAYWPWVQSLRSLLRDEDPEAVRAELGAGAAEVSQILPEVRELVPDLPSPPPIESEGARFRLFDATATFIKNAAARQPLVLVLDDLHAADTPSLLLLRFAAGELAQGRILMVCAYRDVELRPTDPLASTLLELQRERTTSRLRLGGLTEVEVARLIELFGGLEPSEALTAAIYSRTEGNPLFIDEVVRLLTAEGRLHEVGDASAWSPAIPQSARDVIGRRLARLSPECNALLAIAAVLGREFRLDALGRAGEMSPDRALDVLHDALAAEVLATSPGARGRLRFSHGLVRDALYDELPAAQRARLHRSVGEMLERVYALDPEPHLAELCHHFYEAAPAAGTEKALDYARRAGSRALEQLAFEEAVRLYKTALEVLEWNEPVEEPVRCDVLLALGDAQMRAGDGPGAKETFRLAAELAQRVGSPDQLGRASLGYGGRFAWSRAAGDEFVVSSLEQALAAVDPESTLRSRLLARLSGALRDAPTRERAVSLSQEAVEMARRLGDPATLAYALDARHVVIWGPDSEAERGALTSEIMRLAEEAGDEERTFQGRFWQLESLLELGDLSGALAGLDDAERIAERLRQPAQLWYVAVTRALLALFQGRLDEAEELIRRALTCGEQAQSWEALVYYRIQMFGLRSAQGRLDEMVETIAQSVADYPAYRVFGCLLASIYCELGDEARCREAFELVAAGDCAGLPRDEEWLFGMTLLAPVCAFLGDEVRALSLHDLMSPYADRNALSVPDLSTGAVSRALGVVAGVAGRAEQAAAHFEHALEMNARMGTAPWLARTQHEYAALLASGDAAGWARADGLLSLAIENYRRVGMGSWARDAEALQRTLSADGGQVEPG